MTEKKAKEKEEKPTHEEGAEKVPAKRPKAVHKKDAPEEQEKPQIEEAPKEATEEGVQQEEILADDSDARMDKQTELVETEKYLNTGAHIGTKFKSGDMRKYIYKMRKDGLFVLDVQVLDQRLKMAAKLLAKYPANKIVVVSRKVYGQVPANAFAEAIGATSLTGRFVPGTFTNPESTHFVEPSIVLITDPENDGQGIEEATKMRLPVVALVSTNNALKNIDLAVPINNKGKKSLALAFWILAKEILKEKGDIKADSEFTKQVEDFEYKMKEEDEEKRFAQKRPRWQQGGKERGRQRGPPREGGRRRR